MTSTEAKAGAVGIAAGDEPKSPDPLDMAGVVERQRAALNDIFDLIGTAPNYGGQVCLSPAKVAGWMITHTVVISEAVRARAAFSPTVKG